MSDDIDDLRPDPLIETPGDRPRHKGPLCPDCFGHQTELMRGGVVYECHECGRAFNKSDSADARRRL